MAEQRLFHATIKNPNSNETEYEAFYKAHKVGDVRQDAGNRHVSRGKREAFTVNHENLTNRPTEFYDRLKDVESKKVVKHDKVPGLGHRWEVQSEDDSPFGAAPVDGGGVPPSLQDFPDANCFTREDGECIAQSCMHAATPDDDDRVGLPEDPDEYDKPLYGSTRGWDLNIRAKPEFYDVGAMLMSEDPIGEMTRQDRVHAIGGFDIPLGSEKPKENGKRTDSGELIVPTEDERERELEILKQDPATYDKGDDEVRAADSRSQAVAYFI